MRLGVRVNSPEILPRVAERLPPGWVGSQSTEADFLYSFVQGGSAPGSTVRRFHLVYADAAQLARTHDLDDALTTLEKNIQRVVATMAPRKVFLHAGVVGWRGRGILLPGRSMSGKSHLVAALVRAGATYYSDEFAVLDRRGLVHPFAAPLQMRHDGDQRADRCSVEALGGRAGTKPLKIGLIVMSRYERGSDTRLRAVPTGRGLLALLDHAVPARRRPRAVLSTLANLVADTSILSGVRGEAKEAAGVVLDRLAAARATDRAQDHAPLRP